MDSAKSTRSSCLFGTSSMKLRTARSQEKSRSRKLYIRAAVEFRKRRKCHDAGLEKYNEDYPGVADIFAKAQKTWEELETKNQTDYVKMPVIRQFVFEKIQKILSDTLLCLTARESAVKREQREFRDLVMTGLNERLSNWVMDIVPILLSEPAGGVDAPQPAVVDIVPILLSEPAGGVDAPQPAVVVDATHSFLL